MTRYDGHSNFHISHHLFPTSYVYAKDVTDVIMNFACKEGCHIGLHPLLTTLLTTYNIKSNSRNLNIQEEVLSPAGKLNLKMSEVNRY
jgi:hypothetical protein